MWCHRLVSGNVTAVGPARSKWRICGPTFRRKTLLLNAKLSSVERVSIRLVLRQKGIFDRCDLWSPNPLLRHWRPTRLHNDWSPSFALWFECQESSRVLTCTAVIWLPDSPSLIPGAALVSWLYLAIAPPPRTCFAGRRGGDPGPVAELLLLPIRTSCTKAFKQPPLWHDDNVQFHTASWTLTVYYVCKVFFQLCSFCPSESTPLQILKPPVSMRRVRASLSYFETYFLCWCEQQQQRPEVCTVRSDC